MNNYDKFKKLYIHNSNLRKKCIIFSRIIIIILFFTIWELLSQLNIINNFIFSSPSNIFKTLLNLFSSGRLFLHINITLIEIITSFLISLILSLIISILLWWNKTLFKIFEPILLIINAIPKVALGPLIIIWIGADYKSIIFMALIITIFSTILSIYNAFINTNSNYIYLLKSFKANKFQILTKIILPYNYMNIINIAKINLSMIFIGVIMGELLVSKKGLGYLIMYGSQVFNINLIITIIFILGFITYLFYIIFSYFDSKIKNYYN